MDRVSIKSFLDPPTPYTLHLHQRMLSFFLANVQNEFILKNTPHIAWTQCPLSLVKEVGR